MFGVDIHAYVLMTNHVHLLMTPEVADGVSRAMHSASHRYTYYFNKAYGRCGALWQPRFHATVIDRDRYLLACHRYIDMNPVRAGLADRPERHPWSSHRFHAFGHGDALITPHPTIIALSGELPARHAAYRALFEDLADQTDFDRIRKASHSGRRIDAAVPPRGRPRKMVSDTNYCGQATARSWAPE